MQELPKVLPDNYDVFLTRPQLDKLIHVGGRGGGMHPAQQRCFDHCWECSMIQQYWQSQVLALGSKRNNALD